MAGRPKGSTNKPKTEDIKEEIKEGINFADVQKLIDDAVKKTLAEVEKKHKKEIEELSDKLSKSSKTESKIPSNDIQVEVMNNTFGTFIIANKKGAKSNMFYRLDKHGDTAIMEYDEFRHYCGQSRKFFESGELVIVNVYGEDGDFEKVLDRQRLTSLYAGDYKISDAKSLLNSDYNTFEKFLDGNPSALMNVAEHAMMLFKAGQFNQGDKQNYFRQKLNNNSLFK